jgi:phosphoglycerate dehydrogenase-like enzyme
MNTESLSRPSAARRPLRGIAALAASGLLAVVTSPAAAAPDAETTATVESLGLEQGDAPVRERAGWRRPAKIVVRTSPDRLAWLGEVADGVELVAAPTAEDALAAVPGADGVIGYCSEALLEAGTDLRWIQLPYAGAERCVSLPAVRERDILVTNAQRIYGPEIAEHVMAMLLMFTRGLYVYFPEQQAGRWTRDAVPEERLWELTGKTMLVVGLGGIGTETARRAHALGMNVIATRGSRREGPDFVSYVGLADELPELIGRADVVVNATPLTPATRGLFDAELFGRMKPTAYFINVGRGGSVVQDDLVTALKEGVIAGAGLDVTDPEPLPEGHPLWSLPNVIITPHIAAGSDVRVRRLWVVMRENLRRYVAGEPMLSIVSVDRGY